MKVKTTTFTLLILMSLFAQNIYAQNCSSATALEELDANVAHPCPDMTVLQDVGTEVCVFLIMRLPLAQMLRFTMSLLTRIACAIFLGGMGH